MASYVAKGIDLSAHNGTVDFKKLKGQVDFIILRAGFGKIATQKDKMFETYYKGCKDNDIPVGVYWFSYCLTETDAILEAKACMECIKGKQFEYPIYFDMEEPKQCKLPKEKCTAIANAFCGELEKNNYWCGVYSMDSFFKNNLIENIQSRYAIWVARVENVKPTYTNKYQMWQYSWKGKFNGINADTDCNYCYINYPNLIINNKKNGYINGLKDKVDLANSPIIPINKNNFYNAPVDCDYAVEMNKNVITTYKYSKAKNKKLSKHFSVYEFAPINKVNGKLYSDDVKVSNRLIQLLEKIYNDFNCSKIIITSGYRTKELDIAVGGSGQGQHCLGKACDFIAYRANGEMIPSKEICIYLEKLGMVYGIGFISRWATHVDTRPITAKWHGTEIKQGCPSVKRLGYNTFEEYFKKKGI